MGSGKVWNGIVSLQHLEELLVSDQVKMLSQDL
jgi:hypothetical protein